MTILEPVLYANGELRLTRHGAGKGGNVLMHTLSNRQTGIVDADKADYRITHMIQLGWRSGPIFDMLAFYERDQAIKSAAE